MILTLLLSCVLTFVELNCENLFDCNHDSLMQDTEFLPEGVRHWTATRYWHKLNQIGKAVLSCSDDLPDLVALCEVENDQVMHDLTRRSLLRNVGYDYLMTKSADARGIDVALMYHPAKFRPICYEYIPVPLIKEMRPTRDIFYVKGLTSSLDTLHLFLLHAPSRSGGERYSRKFRMQVAQTLIDAITMCCGVNGVTTSNILIAGDFNDYDDSPALKRLERFGVVNVSKNVSGRSATSSDRGKYGVRGTYRYRGEWRSLDHVFLSPPLVRRTEEVYVNDALFLLEEEPVYGGYRPRRTYNGYRYDKGGVSDHLPLVVRFR